MRGLSRAVALVLAQSSASRAVLAAAPSGPTAAPSPLAAEPAQPPPPPEAPEAPALAPGLPARDANGDAVSDAGERDRLELKFGRGVSFHSADDDFYLQLRGRVQTRFESASADGSETVNGFSIRRARLAFVARFFDAWELYLQLGFSQRDNEPDYYNPLRDAAITYAGFRDALVRVGQMKVPFDRQRTTSSSALQFADRSIVMSELTLDRDVGAQLFSEDLGGLGGLLGYHLGVFAGDGRNRAATNAGLMVVGRLWTSPFGKFDPQVEADLGRERRFRLALGVAAAHNSSSIRARSTSSDSYEFATFDFTHLTADLTVKWRGFSWLSEVLYRRADQPSVTEGSGASTVTEYSRSAWGFFTQAGYMWTEHLETAARYGELYPLSPTDPTLLRQRELGGALSWYFSGHDLKLTADYFWLPVLPSGPDAQQVRLQGQLFF